MESKQLNEIYKYINISIRTSKQKFIYFQHLLELIEWFCSVNKDLIFDFTLRFNDALLIFLSLFGAISIIIWILFISFINISRFIKIVVRLMSLSKYLCDSIWLCDWKTNSFNVCITRTLTQGNGSPRRQSNKSYHSELYTMRSSWVWHMELPALKLRVC